MTMSTATAYPVRVDATLQAPLSRWLWLLKWILVIPHVLLLVLLWIGFVFSALASLVVIVFTGRYPRRLFAYNLGVLRWSWRVGYYSFGAFGTDKYPPFTLGEAPDYPARLDVEYPEHLSHGLVLVKWLLGLPHYIIVGLLIGGSWFGASNAPLAWGGGLVGILALVAVVIVAFKGTYPNSLFDLIVGLDRWVLRVAAYGALMTDEYPPFRLDVGGQDPSSAQLPIF